MKKLLLIFFLPILLFAQPSNKSLYTRDTSWVATQYWVTSQGYMTNATLGTKLDTTLATATLRSQWSTAYTDRLKWDGGATGLVAATGRTSLGLGTMALTDSVYIKSLIALKKNIADSSGINGYATQNNLLSKVAYSDTTSVIPTKAFLSLNHYTKTQTNTLLGAKLDTTLATTALRSQWSTAYTNTHTHSNKAKLDSLTASASILNLTTESFTTGLKSTYDGYAAGKIGWSDTTSTIPTKIFLSQNHYTKSQTNTLLGAKQDTTYLSGITSNIQLQLNAKAPIANPTFTGLAKLDTDTLATKAYARSVGGVAPDTTVYALKNYVIDNYYLRTAINTFLNAKLDTTLATAILRTNWSTAYTDRLKWDGGATGLVAATGRTSLGLGTMALTDSVYIKSLIALKLNISSILRVAKTADEIVNNSNTYQADDHLILTVEAATYKFKLYVFGTNADATPGLKLALYTNTADNITVSKASVGNTTTEILDEITLTEATIAGTSGSSQTGTTTHWKLAGSGVFTSSGTITFAAACTLTVQWTQSTAHASNTTLKKGSYLELIKVE